MKNMYIIGAGGFARELYSYLEPYDFEFEGYKLAGFLDDNQDALNKFNLKHQILDTLRAKQLDPSARLIMGVASCSLKSELYSYYKDLGFNFLTYYHPTAIIALHAKIGEGSVFCPYSVVSTAHITVGNCVTVNGHSSIGHDARLGNFCTLSAYCDITGGVNVAEKVFMGTHVCIIPNVKIGAEAILGAGSVVIRDILPKVTAFGNPAKIIKS